MSEAIRTISARTSRNVRALRGRFFIGHQFLSGEHAVARLDARWTSRATASEAPQASRGIRGTASRPDAIRLRARRDARSRYSAASGCHDDDGRYGRILRASP